jgi:hypothetical protein
MGANIRDVLHRRTDLSTFIVHLTRSRSAAEWDQEQSAKDCLYRYLHRKVGQLGFGRPRRRRGLRQGPTLALVHLGHIFRDYHSDIYRIDHHRNLEP